jgi:hypothetical protein
MSVPLPRISPSRPARAPCYLAGQLARGLGFSFWFPPDPRAPVARLRRLLRTIRIRGKRRCGAPMNSRRDEPRPASALSCTEGGVLLRSASRKNTAHFCVLRETRQGALLRGPGAHFCVMDSQRVFGGKMHKKAVQVISPIMHFCVMSEITKTQSRNGFSENNAQTKRRSGNLV